MSETKFNPKDHIIKMKGKDYLEVKWRLVWFKEENAKGTISTEILNTNPVLAKASILVDGVLLATGHGSATPKGNSVWSGREIEKAETAAIGRALAHAGYGTQFTDEDETDNIVDSPVERKATETKNPMTLEDAEKYKDANGELYTAKSIEQLQKIVNSEAAPQNKKNAALRIIENKRGNNEAA